MNLSLEKRKMIAKLMNDCSCLYQGEKIRIKGIHIDENESLFFQSEYVLMKGDQISVKAGEFSEDIYFVLEDLILC